MNVLFLTLYPDVAASPRYRVHQFLPHLEARGVACTVACAVTEEEYRTLTGPARVRRPFWYHFHETRRRLAQVLRAGTCDVVFLQKAVMTAYLRGMAGLLRRRARRIVLDIDDAVHLAPPHPLRGPWRLFEDRRQITKLFGCVDMVLAGNPWLVSEVESYGVKAELFPTVVDTDRFAPGRETSPRFRIGWIGGPSTTRCLEPALEALKAVSDSGAEVRLIGADSRWSSLEGFCVQPWTLDAEVSELQSMSVGIMPLTREEWMRGKCALKALQYMACGVPCVATPFGAVREIIVAGENGLFAETPAEWSQAFERLRDPALRARLGANGRATVAAGFSLDQAAPRLFDLLESIL